ncbi:MAG: sensor histidine kinase [Novosphingobium sp.]
MPDSATPVSIGRLARLEAFSGVTGWRRLAIDCALGVAVFVAVVALKEVIDLYAAGVAPYALVYPGVLLATLIGRLRAGLIAWALCFGYIVAFGIPHAPGVIFARALDLPRFLINVAIGLLMVVIGEIARAASAEALRQRDARLRERELLLAEIDHRLQNNLAILSSLIDMQIRDAESDEVREALRKTAGRVQSLGQTYAQLRFEPGAVAAVQMDRFLADLTDSLRKSLDLGDRIALTLTAEPCQLARDRSAALALLVNEIVTNAVKHAFTGRERGTIALTLICRDGGAELAVVDDGIGMSRTERQSGKGNRLLLALAQMARCKLSVSSGPEGTAYRLVLPEVEPGAATTP